MTVVLLMLAGSGPPQQKAHAPKTQHHISIALIHNVWRAVRSGTDSSEVRVHAGDDVYFHAVGSDVYFQFDNPHLFGVINEVVKKGHWIHFVVGKVAPGTYYYSAFCEGPKVFARGDSPPKIIVD